MLTKEKRKKIILYILASAIAGQGNDPKENAFGTIDVYHYLQMT